MTERPKNALIKERLGKPKDLDVNNLPANIEKWFAEPKLDGLRGIIIKPKTGKSKAYTSNGIDVVNAQFICRAIDKNIKGGWVFDGEFFTNNWNDTQSLVMTQTNHPDAKKLRLRVFDVIPYKDWINKTSGPLSHRKAQLDRLVAHIDERCIVRIPFQLIKNKKSDIHKAYKNILKDRYEGLMLKDPHAAYPFKRDKCWRRLKPKHTIDCEVLGVKPGNGKYVGLIGSLHCRFTEDETQITFNCSGMTDDQRVKLTKVHKSKKLVGRMVEVEHEGVTVGNKVRFPQFKRMRPDKD